MPQYGEVRVDYITYTTGVVPSEGNRTVTVSSLIGSPTFTGDVIISGNTFISGQLDVSGNVIFDQNLNVTLIDLGFTTRFMNQKNQHVEISDVD